MCVFCDFRQKYIYKFVQRRMSIKYYICTCHIHVFLNDHSYVYSLSISEINPPALPPDKNVQEAMRHAVRTF
jgi:hypothetical protein